MATDGARQFMQTLQEAERSGDVGPLAALFAPDAELSNLARPDPHRGVDETHAFWADYLGFFGQIRSTFTHVLESHDGVVLEWVSDGTLRAGSPVSYRGVSVLEMKGGLVRRFRTYYDSAALQSVAAKTGS